MSSPVDIYVGDTGIGQVALKNDQVRGEGGPFDPRLVFPLDITLYPRPQKQALALLDMTCSLHLAESAFDNNRTGPAVTVPLARDQLRYRSFPQAPTTQGFELRIPLTHPLVALIESHRHTSQDKTFRAVLHLAPTVGWLHQIGTLYEQMGRLTDR